MFSLYRPMLNYISHEVSPKCKDQKNQPTNNKVDTGEKTNQTNMVLMLKVRSKEAKEGRSQTILFPV